MAMRQVGIQRMARCQPSAVLSSGEYLNLDLILERAVMQKPSNVAETTEGEKGLRHRAGP